MTDGALNGISHDALAETVAVFANDRSLAAFTFRVRNRWIGGGQSRSDVDDYFGVCEERRRKEPFHLYSDGPAALLGSDKAPSAVEYLLHAMASCVTVTLLQLATIRALAIREVETRIVGHIDLLGMYGLDESVRSGFEGIEVQMTVKGEAAAEDLEDLCALAWKRSPVFDMVTHGVPVTILPRIETVGPDLFQGDLPASG